MLLSLHEKFNLHFYLFTELEPRAESDTNGGTRCRKGFHISPAY